MHRSLWWYTFNDQDELIDVSPRSEITEAEVHEEWLRLADKYSKYPTTMPQQLREMLASLIYSKTATPPE